jgi:hypothetical protein
LVGYFGDHFRQARVFHYFGIDAVALGARLVDDVSEDHGFAGFQFDALRKRRVFAGLHIVSHAFYILKGAMVAPDFTSGLRHAPISCEVFLRHG